MAGNTRHVVFTNGKVFQSRKSHVSGQYEASFAETLIVKDGVITFVGPSEAEDVKQAIAAGAEVRSVQDHTIMPGLYDGHVHLVILGQSLRKLRLDHCANLDEIRATIKEYAVANPDVPRIFCRGWMYTMTPDGAHANMIDDVDTKGRPILITSKDLHASWANSAALAELKLDDYSDPLGGTIERDRATGKPSGVITDAANMLYVRPYLARIATMKDRTEAIREAIKQYNAAGYTGLIDMAMDQDAWESLQELRKEEAAAGRRLPIHIAVYWLILPKDDLRGNLEQVEHAAALAREFQSHTHPDCRVVGIKLVCDGIVDGCTASLKEPYSHNLQSVDPIWTPEHLAPVVEAASRHGLQVALHAIGDRTITNAVDVIEKHAPGSLRPRIEHLELSSAEDAKRLGKLGITASIHPVHADPAILRAWPELIGPERLSRAFAYREFADAGAPLAIGSDSPSAPHEFVHNTYVATTRRSAREPELETVVNPNFALTLCETVVGLTEGAARSCFDEERVGSLDVGKRADIVIMDIEWEPNRLLDSTIVETWFGGELVYSAP
ncbi:amidohydrolase [Thozetella sp. PMI_491]|nr:amidohydrolase [Thozetella sp. PMI_491]